MTTEAKVARRKLSLLELAAEMSDVGKACKMMGFSRQRFYEIRRNYQTFGAEGLIDRLPDPKDPHPNRVDEAVEQAILDYCLVSPCHGSVAVANQLVLKGVNVSAGGVRGVWSRHNLIKHDRLLRLEKSAREQKLELTDS